MNNMRHKLSRELSVTIMLMAVPIFLLALGALYVQSRYLIRKEASERATSCLNTTMLRVKSYMNTIETSLNTNAWLLEENFNPDSLESISRRIMSLNRNIISSTVCVEPNMFPQYGRNFSVYNTNEGDTIVSYREYNYDYLSQAWYRNIIKSNNAEWVDPFHGFSEVSVDENEAVASYCVPLRPKGGRIAGVISADFSFKQLADVINSTECPYPSAYFVLVGSDGRYLVHPDYKRLFRRTIFTDADPNSHSKIIVLGHEMTAGKKGHMHIMLNDLNCHVSYCPVPGTDWSMALISPDSEITKSQHQLGYVILIIIAIGLLLIWWLCNKVVKMTISPIHEMLFKLQRIADGHYDEAIPASDRHDTIGLLQNSFSKMQQVVNDHMRNVEQTAEKIRENNEGIERAMGKLEESARQKEKFTQNVLHQIRTPLNIIQGFALVLNDSLTTSQDGTATTMLPENELSSITEMMKHNSIQLNHMVIMLYDSSETTEAADTKYERSDEIGCNAVAQESIAHAHRHYPNAVIRFETELADNVCILSNHLYLMKSMCELLYNSAKYSDGEHIRLHVSQMENFIRFTFEDIGPGLSEDAESMIFKPFMKVDDLSEGLGLGLPLCNRHLASLGGKLIYDTTYRSGCRFFMDLPK